MSYPNDNYYDISISTNQRQQPGPNIHSASSLSLHHNTSTSSLGPSPIVNSIKKGPKRIGSLSSMSVLNEYNSPYQAAKRPGDYFMQKMASSSNLNLSRKDPTTTNSGMHRPYSGESIVSLHSNFSDEASSVVSSQFDNSNSTNIPGNTVIDSRLSSMTSNSIINSSPMDSPSYSKDHFNRSSASTGDDEIDVEATLDSHSTNSGDEDYEIGNNSDLFNYEYSTSSVIEGSDTNGVPESNASLSTITSKNNSELLTSKPSPTVPSSGYFGQLGHAGSMSTGSVRLPNARSFSASSTVPGESTSQNRLNRTQSQSSNESASSLTYSHPTHMAPSRSMSSPSIYKSNNMSRPGQLNKAAILTTPSNSSAPTLVRSNTTNNTLSRTLSTSSTVSFQPLTRTKTRYLSAKEKKERQLSRKKKYEEDDNDDDILSNDMDNLVFNVPVIKKHAELYSLSSSSSSHSNLQTPSTRKSSRSGSLGSNKLDYPASSTPTKSALFTHSDLINDNDYNKYNIGGHKPNPPVNNSKPNKLTIQTDFKNATKFNATEDSIVEEDEDETKPPTHILEFDDSEITQNISNFYNERSSSNLKILKSSREQTMMYKLPNFVKAQSSVDDLNLMSQEKLNVIDQSRPVHLPPKNDIDKSKHNKEFQKILSSYELNTKNFNQARKKHSQQTQQNQQQWLKLILGLVEDPNPKSFNKKFTADKVLIRKLGWESNVPPSLRYQFFTKILTNSNEGSIDTIKKSFITLDEKFRGMSDTIKSNKDSEFDNTINGIMKRPLFESILKEIMEKSGSSSPNINGNQPEFSLLKFQENYRYLLFIKSLSETGLRKHDEIFLIPILLIMFQQTQTVQDIYCLLELIDHEVFTRDLLSTLNTLLDSWTNIKLAGSTSSHLAKFLTGFKDNLLEFGQLNSNSFFDILIQFNDKLPLSLSAPSTPIMSQHSFSTFSTPGSLPTSFASQSPGSGGLGEHSGTPNSLTPRSSEGAEDTVIDVNSSALQLMVKLLQMLIIYSNSSKTKKANILKIFQTFLMVIFQYYHIGWNDFQDLIRTNKSIKLNHSVDQVKNLGGFVEKWADIFKRF